MSQNGGIASTNVFHCVHTNPCMLMIAYSTVLVPRPLARFHQYCKQQGLEQDLNASLLSCMCVQWMASFPGCVGGLGTRLNNRVCPSVCCQLENFHITWTETMTQLVLFQLRFMLSVLIFRFGKKFWFLVPHFYSQLQQLLKRQTLTGRYLVVLQL